MVTTRSPAGWLGWSIVRIWWAAAGGCWVLGLASMSVRLSPADVLCVIGVVVVAVWCVGSMSDRPVQSRVHPATVAAATVTVLAAYGLVVALHATGACLVALLVATSPALLAWVARQSDGGRRLRGPRPEPPRRASRPVPRPDADVEHDLACEWLQTVDDELLCWLWRASFRELQRAESAEQQERVVSARRRYLDELDRRRPTEFRHWIDGGARAASDPRRYWG